MARPNRLDRLAERRVPLGPAFMLGAAVTVMLVAVALRSWVDVLVGFALAASSVGALADVPRETDRG